MNRILFLIFVLLLTACGTSTTPSQPNEPSASNHKPVVILEVKTTSEKRGIEAVVTVTDEDKDPLTYEWDFGDGTTASTEEGYIHSYQASGTYTVSVKVSDGKNEVIVTKDVKVQHLRPAGSPDVFVFGFAGRCGAV